MRILSDTLDFLNSVKSTRDNFLNSIFGGTQQQGLDINALTGANQLIQPPQPGPRLPSAPTIPQQTNPLMQTTPNAIPESQPERPDIFTKEYGRDVLNDLKNARLLTAVTKLPVVEDVLTNINKFVPTPREQLEGKWAAEQQGDVLDWLADYQDQQRRQQEAWDKQQWEQEKFGKEQQFKTTQELAKEKLERDKLASTERYRGQSLETRKELARMHEAEANKRVNIHESAATQRLGEKKTQISALQRERDKLLQQIQPLEERQGAGIFPLTAEEVKKLNALTAKKNTIQNEIDRILPPEEEGPLPEEATPEEEIFIWNEATGKIEE